MLCVCTDELDTGLLLGQVLIHLKDCFAVGHLCMGWGETCGSILGAKVYKNSYKGEIDILGLN